MAIKDEDGSIMKKSISVLLIMVMTLLCMVPVAAATSGESYAGNQLRILGILRGYEDGSLKLDQSIVRAEVAALTVRILGYEDTEVEGDGREFTDVDGAYWASDVIQKAYKLEVIKGYPDLSFKPLGNITYAEVVAIMVGALGEQEDLVGEWPYNYINKGKDLGIIPADSDEDPSKVITRGEMSVIVWDTLLVKQ